MAGVDTGEPADMMETWTQPPVVISRQVMVVTTQQLSEQPTLVRQFHKDAWNLNSTQMRVAESWKQQHARLLEKLQQARLEAEQAGFEAGHMAHDLEDVKASHDHAVRRYDEAKRQLARTKESNRLRKKQNTQLDRSLKLVAQQLVVAQLANEDYMATTVRLKGELDTAVAAQARPPDKEALPAAMPHVASQPLIDSAAAPSWPIAAVVTEPVLGCHVGSNFGDVSEACAGLREHGHPDAEPDQVAAGLVAAVAAAESIAEANRIRAMEDEALADDLKAGSHADAEGEQHNRERGEGEGVSAPHHADDGGPWLQQEQLDGKELRSTATEDIVDERGHR